MQASPVNSANCGLVKVEFASVELPSDTPAPLSDSVASSHAGQLYVLLSDQLAARQQQWQAHAAAPVVTSLTPSSPGVVVRPAKKLRKGKRLLWQFLLHDLLEGHSDLVWHADQPANPGVFAFKDPNAAAKRWGRYKENENMSYEKMSRCIRDYYTRKANRHFGVMQPDPLAEECPSSTHSSSASAKRRRLHFVFNLRHAAVVQYIRQHSASYYHRLLDMKLVAM